MPRKFESGDVFGYLVFFGLLAVMFIGFSAVGNWRGNEALTTHTFTLKDESRLELLWTKTVFTSSADNRTIATTSGKVFFIGSLKQYNGGGLVALDGETGDMLWMKYENRFAYHTSILEAGTDMVYVDYSGSVIAYNLNGKKLWRTHRWENYLSSITTLDGKMYISSYENYLVDATTGDLLATSSDTYIFDKRFNHELDWDFGYLPTFTEHRMFMRAWKPIAYGEFSAAIAIDRDSEEILWRTADNVISNVAASESLAFVITYEDELQILNAKTGKLLETIQIEPSINYFAQERQMPGRVYQLAVDQTTPTLYVLLGDSNQLFAFHIHE